MNVHRKSSLVESFERKLIIHGYNWDGVDGGNNKISSMYTKSMMKNRTGDFCHGFLK